MNVTEGKGEAMATRGTGAEVLEELLRVVRREQDRAAVPKFEGARSEMALRSVLSRVRERRRIGAWFGRTIRSVTALGVALWNSRAFRALVP